MTPCTRCGATMRQDGDVLRETLGRKLAIARVVCANGHSRFIPFSDGPGGEVGSTTIVEIAPRLALRPGRKRTAWDGRNRARVGAQAHHAGRRAENRQARYRERMRLCGLCPHCGKPCAPYATCAARRAYKRHRYALVVDAASAVARSA